MRVLRNLAWFAVGFLLSTWMVFAHAETVAATSTTVNRYYLPGMTADYPDGQGACNASLGTGMDPGILSNPSGSSSVTYNVTYFTCYYSPYGGSNTVNRRSTTQYTCPDSSWTLSGSSCTRVDCTAGQVMSSDFGKCVPVCLSEQHLNSTGSSCVCDSGRGLANWGSWREGSGTAPDWVCIGGCQVNINFAVSMGGQWGGKIGRSNGSTCNTHDAASADQHKQDAETKKNVTPQGCLTMGQGYITNSSGITTCVAPGDSPQPLEIKKKESVSNTAPDGSTTQKDTTTTQTCVGGNCTVNEVTNVTAPGGGVSTSSSTSDKDAYCANNPNASICKKCASGSKELSCMEAGDVEDAGTVDTKAIGPSSVSPVAVTSNAQCPTGAQLPKGLGYYNWDPMCQMASALKPIVLAFAWLAAGLIVLTGKAD